MESQTLSLEIACPADRAYEYIRNPMNLPKWAPGFFKSISQQGGRWMAETSLGPMEIRFAEPNPFGVLDHSVKTGDAPEIPNPMRVLPNDAGSQVLFTLFRRPGMSAAEFEEDRRLVLNDLESLKKVLEGR